LNDDVVGARLRHHVSDRGKMAKTERVAKTDESREEDGDRSNPSRSAVSAVVDDPGGGKRGWGGVVVVG
jgi:hypothetical protein